MKDKMVGWIVNRIRDNQNALCFISGGTGSGKSYSALRVAQDISNQFNKRFIAKNITFTMKQFMDRMNSGELQTGSVLIFDEFGVGMNSRASLTIANRIFGFLLQTFRHKNFVCIFTSPHFGFVDLSARRLFHLWFETKDIDRKRNLCLLKPHFGRTDQKTGELKWTMPKLGLNKVLGTYKVKLPSKKLIEEYEQMKQEYTKELNKNILEQLMNVDAWGREKKEEKPKIDPEYKERMSELLEKAKLRKEYGI